MTKSKAIAALDALALAGARPTLAEAAMENMRAILKFIRHQRRNATVARAAKREAQWWGAIYRAIRAGY